jgi:Lar family restriction alleviation protein
MSDDLKPCPFCGGNAKRYYRADDSGWENTYWVGCTDGCGASTACYETKALAVTVWNTRIDTDDMADRIEGLEAKLAKEIEIGNQRGNHIEFVLLPQMSDLHFQLKDVKAKLAKALDVDLIEQAISDVLSEGGTYRDAAEYVACTTIAELKGEDRG